MKRIIQTLAILVVSFALSVPTVDAQGRRDRNGGRATPSTSQQGSRGGGHSQGNSSQSGNRNNGGYRGGGRPDNGHSAVSNSGNRPGNGNNHGTVSNSGTRPGNGNNHGTVSNGGTRPGNGNNHGTVSNGGNRPGNGNNHGAVSNSGTRPGNGNNHGTVSNGGTRPGNGPGNGNRPQGGNNYRPEPGHAPGHGPQPGHGPGHGPGIRPPHGAPLPIYRPVYHNPWVRPVPPHAWRPGPRVPVFSTILGLTFGIGVNATLDFLVNNNYTIYAYNNNEVYLNNVTQLNLVWPDATLFYSGGRLDRGDFIYATTYYDTSRYNIAYSRLVNAYGNPVSTTYPTDGLRTTWYGLNGRFVTLTYQPLYGADGIYRYYTTLSFGM